MNIEQQLGEWYPLLSHCFEEEWMKRLGRRLGAEKDIVPSLDQVFRAFTLCPPGSVKAVIIGQDPYIRGEADGLAFSSKYSLTPTLDIVFQEINRTEHGTRTDTNLEDWAQQGVLLLNSVLTTRFGVSGAHQGWGWEFFIQEALKVIKSLPQPLAIMLWGNDAKIVARRHVWENKNRFLLYACHPVAQSRGSSQFTGCKHFWLTNRFLVINRIDPIWWPNPASHTEDRYRGLITSLVNDHDYAQTAYAQKLYMSPGMGQRWREDDRFRLGPQYADDLPF